MEWRRDGYLISDDRDRLDLDVIWGFLRMTYWSPGVPREYVERAIAGSRPFGLYTDDGHQVGFARVVTDGAVHGWLADVFVLEAHRGQGLSKWLVETILATKPFNHLRMMLLGTEDAHDLYSRFGFEANFEGRYMALLRPPETSYPDSA